MRFGCCVKTLQEVDILARAGFDFCELPAATVQPFEDDAAALPALRAIDAAPLRPESFNLLIPPQLPLVGPEADLAAVQAYARRAFPRMARLGAALAVLGSGPARRIPDGTPRAQGLDQLATALALLGEEASRAGLQLALEHLNQAECNVFTTLAESQTFLEQRGLASVWLIADLHHLEVEHEPLQHVAQAAPRLVHVQVADGGRRAPGLGGYDYAGFMRALRAANYDRRISAECRWDDLATQAAGALAFMRQQWDDSAAPLPGGFPGGP